MKPITAFVTIGVGVAFVASAVTAASNGKAAATKKVVVAVSGDCFCCLDCFLGFKEPVLKVKGVKEVTARLAKRQATVEYDPNVASLDDIAKAVKEKGYTIKPVSAKLAVQPNPKTSSS